MLYGRNISNDDVRSRFNMIAVHLAGRNSDMKCLSLRNTRSLRW